MERILVAMDPLHTHLFAGIHALNLAKRINARVSFLLVFPGSTMQSSNPTENENAFAVKKNVEALIEEARSDGITVDYYAASGNYENELVNFVHENRVSLLVVESAAGQGDSGEAARHFLDRLRHRIDCRIEVVNEKPKTPKRKE
jgi:nucleotide-binding universal stress UspA family protein